MHTVRHLGILALLLAACGHEPPPPEPLPAPAELNAAAAPAEAAPRERARVLQHGPFLRAADTTWNWGVATAGAELRHLFVLHNDGDQPIRIVKTRPT